MKTYIQVTASAIFIAFFKCPLWAYIVILTLAKLIDMGFGVWKVSVLKQEFNWNRFFQGFLVILLYLIVLTIADLIDKSIIQTAIYGHERPLVKVWTIAVISLEYVSVERKRKACGKTALLEIIRNLIKVAKEISVSFKSISK